MALVADTGVEDDAVCVEVLAPKLMEGMITLNDQQENGLLWGGSVRLSAIGDSREALSDAEKFGNCLLPNRDHLICGMADPEGYANDF